MTTMYNYCVLVQTKRVCQPHVHASHQGDTTPLHGPSLTHLPPDFCDATPDRITDRSAANSTMPGLKRAVSEAQGIFSRNVICATNYKNATVESMTWIVVKTSNGIVATTRSLC
jgi:hypothetical protein